MTTQKSAVEQPEGNILSGSETDIDHPTISQSHSMKSDHEKPSDNPQESTTDNTNPLKRDESTTGEPYAEEEPKENDLKQLTDGNESKTHQDKNHNDTPLTDSHAQQHKEKPQGKTPEFTDPDQSCVTETQNDYSLAEQDSENKDKTQQPTKGNTSHMAETNANDESDETHQTAPKQNKRKAQWSHPYHSDGEPSHCTKPQTEPPHPKQGHQNDDITQQLQMGDESETCQNKDQDETSLTEQEQHKKKAHGNDSDYKDGEPSKGTKSQGSVNDDYSTAVPLCLPSNFKWNQDSRTVECIDGGNRESRGHVCICDEGMKLLESIGDNLVIVVCITGPARTGKSFLLSQFHESLNFELGHSTVSHTTGIWVALSPEKIQIGRETARVILLDAEGLDAMSTTDDGGTDDWDRKLFSLCTLLSSCMIYNNLGTPHASDLDKLGVVTQLSEAIYYNTQEANMKTAEEEFLKNAPHFVWVIRDAQLQPKDNAGTECSWDECVRDSVLTLKQKESSRNTVRKAINRVFKSIHALGLPAPVSHSDDFSRLSSRNDDVKIKSKFLEGVQEVKSIIFFDPKDKVKRIQGCAMNGYSFKDMLTLYVAEVNKETDKLPVANVSEVIIKSQLSSAISKAIEKYSDLFEPIELPQERNEVTNVHQRAIVEAHSVFDNWTRRIDEEFTKESKQQLSEKLEQLFQEIMEKNNTASKHYCLSVMESLKDNLIKRLKSNVKTNGCADITNANKQLLEDYRKRAKGPMVDSVLSNYELQIKKTIYTYKEIMFQNSKREALKLYEDNTTMSGLFPFENEEIVKVHKNAEEICLDFLTRTYDQCNDCQQEKINFLANVKRLLEQTLKSNETISQTFCEKKAQELKSKHFDKAQKYLHSRSFSFFQEAKNKVLDEYNESAKGPAKETVGAKCKADMEIQLDVIQTTVADAALKDACDSYRISGEKIIQGGPIEDEKLKSETEAARKNVKRHFDDRCNGISEMKIRENTLALERFIENRNDYLQCRNIIQSCDLCDQVCINVSKECDLMLSEWVKTVVNKHFDESLDCGSMLKEVKKQMFQRYSERAKGPMKEKFMGQLENLIHFRFALNQNLVVDDALGKAVDHFDKLLKKISNSGPYDTQELHKKLQTAESEVQLAFDKRSETFDKQLVNRAKANLQKIINSVKNKSVYENETKSFEHCEGVMIKTIRRHSEHWETRIFSMNLDNITAFYDLFTRVKEDYISEYKKEARGALSSKFEQTCRTEIDKQIREFQNDLANSNLSTLISKFRKTIEENIVKNMPLAETELQKRKACEYSVLFTEFNKICQLSEGKDVEKKDKQLKASAADILSKLDGMNYKTSVTQCEEISKAIKIEILEKQCTLLLTDCNEKVLNSTFHPVKKIHQIKTACLADFDVKAKGPAKTNAREKFSNDIDVYLFEIKRAIFKDAIEKATEMYDSQFRTINDEEFLDNIQLTSLKTQKADEVKALFHERCKESDIVTTEDFKELLEKAITEIDGKIKTRHAKLSRQCCQKLAKDLGGGAKNSFCDLASLVKRQDTDPSIDVPSKITEIERKYLTEYDQKAKGIEKCVVLKSFKIMIQNELHVTLREISKSFLTKAFNKFRSRMNAFIAQGPHEENVFSLQCNNFVQEALQFFQNSCRGLDESIYQNDADTLKSYLENASQDFKKENEFKSLNFCSDILKDLLATRKLYKRKMHFMEEYWKRAKGPMAEEALSKFTDPIDTHYKSWYALFHRWSFGKPTVKEANVVTYPSTQKSSNTELS